MTSDYSPSMTKDIKSLVGPTAHVLSRKYYRFTDARDIAQELWLWALTHPRQVNKFLDREDAAELKSGMKGLAKTLYREGDQYCRKQKAMISGYRHTDEFFYTQTLIEALIVAEANDGKMLENTVDDMPRKIKLLAETGDINAMLADLSSAMDRLDEDTAEMVRQHVAHGKSSARLGEMYGISRQAVDQRITRAFDRLMDALGGPSPW